MRAGVIQIQVNEFSIQPFCFQFCFCFLSPFFIARAEKNFYTLLRQLSTGFKTQAFVCSCNQRYLLTCIVTHFLSFLFNQLILLLLPRLETTPRWLLCFF